MLQDRELEQMGKDKFHAGQTPLSFSVDRVSLTIVPGEVKEGAFSVFGRAISGQGESINGFVSSSTAKMKCLHDTFSGDKDEIGYRFDGSTCRVGDTAEGFFRIISDHGEYQIPFDVKVVPNYLNSSLGQVRNLFHFTNLAKTKWREAVDIFYHPSFADIFAPSEEKERGLYRGLSTQKGNQHNVDEFLMAIGKKRAVEFLTTEKEIRMDLPIPEGGDITGTLDVSRNGWGYTRASVRAIGDFISLPQKELTDDNFRAGSYSLPYVIEKDKLHTGWNGGAIQIISAYKVIEIPVSVTYCVSTALGTIHHRKKQTAIKEMMQGYEAFRDGKLALAKFLDTVQAQISQLSESDRNNPLTYLYRIHYLLTAEKSAEALYELQHYNRLLSGDVDTLPPLPTAQFDLESDEEYSYRMYLTMLCAEDSMNESNAGAGFEENSFASQDITDRQRYLEHVGQDAARAIEIRHKRNPENFWIAWLYLYSGGESLQRPSVGWRILKEQFSFGSRSPLLYMEAYRMVKDNPLILRGLGDFEQQVLWYAAKHDILTEQVMTQVNNLAVREKTFSFRLFHILEKGYELSRRETLQSICTLLIRGNMTESVYFPWYQRGVKEELLITRLYDYYMMSIPRDYNGEIPNVVLLYFVYQNTLPAQKAAFLYRYVLEHRRELGELYEHYHMQIESFTLSQLGERRIDDDLAALYRIYLQPDRLIAAEIAPAAIPVSFMCRVKTSDDRMHRVVLIYDKCNGESYYPMQDKTAYLPIYGEEKQLFLEDDAGNRYVSGVDFSCEHLLDYKALAQMLSGYDTEQVYFDMYLSGMTGSYFGISDENYMRFRRLIDSNILTPAWTHKVRMELLRFYENTGKTEELSAVLKNMTPGEAGMTASLRGRYLGYLIRQKQTEKALSWVLSCGSEGMKQQDIQELCAGTLEEIAGESEESENAAKLLRAPEMVGLMTKAFEIGGYDEKLLRYLEKYLDATTKELAGVHRAMVSLGLKDTELCRRILIQLLYSGAKIPEREEIIETYLDEAGEIGDQRSEHAENAGHDLMTRVIAQSAHNYFVSGEKMSRRQFDQITVYGQEGVPIVDICRIAWLKDRAERSGETAGEEREVISLFLSDLMGQDIVFPFFRQFIGVMPQLQAYADETLVEYHAKNYVPGKRVLYHYAMEKGGSREPYAAKEMKEMYEGVYVTGFLLFFGEQMQYYITDDAAEKHIVESGTIGQDARIFEESADRFGEINRIAMLMSLGRDEEAVQKLGDYTRRAYLTSHIFV